ncbi:hypothetical protein [Streptomyces bathyalis]|uniref:hypothetical protein n=1 Tax=Streptomyces bathyalis TaxID=2710756 RepID=UPI001FE38582|nr:hypothetical protein [Streptomyces bathyalis]
MSLLSSTLLTVPTARFFFDPGSGGVLWIDDPQGQQAWGNPTNLNRLPISSALREELARLIAWFDTSLNWEYPPDPGPWREDECGRFNIAAHSALARLRGELGPRWQITDGFREVHEDPDLDRYLADPACFRR